MPSPKGGVHKLSNVTKQGIVYSNNFIEQEQYGKQASFGKILNPNLQTGQVTIYTNKRGTISSSNTLASISAATVESLAGKTLCMSYECACNGVRYSTEQGQTAWNQIRYGIHGSCSISGSTQYPFAGYLGYSGPATRLVQTWTVPTGASSYGGLGFSVQNFDKPASTNNETWFIRNFKLEVFGGATPYVLYEYGGSGDVVDAQEFIEW